MAHPIAIALFTAAVLMLPGSTVIGLTWALVKRRAP